MWTNLSASSACLQLFWTTEGSGLVCSQPSCFYSVGLWIYTYLDLDLFSYHSTFATSQHMIPFRMHAWGGGSSKDLGPLCLNSTLEPRKLQNMYQKRSLWDFFIGGSCGASFHYKCGTSVAVGSMVFCCGLSEYATFVISNQWWWKGCSWLPGCFALWTTEP